MTMELARLVGRLGLDVATVASAHGRNGTIDELREAVANSGGDARDR